VKTLAFLASPTRCLSIAVLVVGLGVLPGACEGSPARFTEPMVLGGETVPPEVLERGARAYNLFCVSCHGADGSGRGNASRSFETPPRDFREADFQHVSGPPGSLPSDADLEETIRRGRPGTGMPAWDGLSAEDLHAVIQYLKTFSPRWRAEAPPAGEAPPP
jgi:mono/diheme cytochrome c family protein